MCGSAKGDGVELSDGKALGAWLEAALSIFSGPMKRLS